MDNDYDLKTRSSRCATAIYIYKSSSMKFILHDKW